MPYIGNQPYQGIIDSSSIADGSIQTGDLANSAVTTAKIADSNITSAKIADTGVTVAKLNSDVTQLIAQGGGPKITGVAITNSSWTTIDDTAVDTAGGYVKLTGTNFVTGCSVVVGTTSATAVTFTSSTELRVQLPAQAAGTYILYVTNPDGGTAIRVNAVTYSATPSWVTSSTLPQQDDGVAISIQLSATSATTYALQAGSTLPSGLTLTSGGLLSGAVSGLASDTSYSFTVVATDAELQDSPRAFTVNIAASDTYFNLTTLLINGDTAPNVLTDASSNNFNLIAYGDARASNFTPYGNGWSNYFDGSGDYLSVANTGLFGSGDWTVELWINAPVGQSDKPILECRNPATGFGTSTGFTLTLITSTEIRLFSGSELLRGTVNYINTWAHVMVSKKSGTTRLYLNGTSVASTTSLGTMSDTTFLVAAGYYGVASVNVHGQFYISGLRVLTGTGYDTTTITVPTAPPTAITNTSLLICNSNRFVDSSSNNLTITRNGDVAVRSFNPFNITNTSADGSMYFDGTGDYVTAPSNAAFGPSGDFTFESWLYWTGGNSENTLFCVDVTGGINIGLAFGTGGANWGIGRRAIALDNEFGTAPIKFTWNHLAVSRQSGTIRAFINGQLVFSGANTVSYVAGPPGIACIATASTNILQGYISNARFVSAALYTANFTPATSPLSPVTNTQLLTLQNKQPHNNHAFQDSSTNNHLITRNGNTTQGTFSPFSPNGWSNLFNGSSTLQTTALNISTGSFTIEAWVYLNAMPTSDSWPGGYANWMNIVCVGGANLADGWQFRIGQTILAFGTNNDTTALTATHSMVVGQWYHLACVRDGNLYTLYRNGVSIGSTTYTANSPGTGAFTWIGSETNQGAYLNGYISNLRIIAGTAIYTTNFTPSTTPFSAVSGTVLLTCQSNRFSDNSTNNFVFTINGSPSVQAFSPFKPTAAYSPATHGGSGYFDGSGDYVRIGTDITPLSFLNTAGAVATIEAWVYATSLRTASNTYTHPCILGIGSTYMNFGVVNGTPRFYWWNGSVGNTLDSSITITANSWNHIAVVFYGTGSNNYKIFVNGALGGTGTFTNIGWASGSGGNNVLVGREESNPATSDWPGYISGLRITNGSALYNSPFTPAITPFTSTSNTTCLLNFTDAAARDSSGRLVLETVGDSKVSVVQKKYGTGSMYFDGTGDGLLSPHYPQLHLNGDFTIELWFYANAYAGMILNKGGGTNIAWASYELVNQTDGINFAASSANTGYDIGSETGATGRIGTITLNTWNHLAVTRSGNIYRGFVNGVQGYTQTLNLTPYNSSPRGLAIGHNYATTWATTTPTSVINGYIDDLRITNGIARYTTNFTPPAQTFKLR